MLKAIMKRRKGTLVLLVILLAVMAYACAEILSIPTYYQRVYGVPAQETAAGQQGESSTAQTENSGLRDERQAAEEVTKTLEGACEKTTLYAVGQPAAVSVEDGASVSARLVGIEESYYGLRDIPLFCGRLIYPDEFLYGERVAMLDEQLAVALFRYAEPLGQKIQLGGENYVITGIVRDHKQVGDEMEYSLYVPLRSLEKNGIGLSALVYEATPVKGAGGWAAFESAVGTMGTSGTTISLSKERMNALMALRMLGIVCGVAVALFCLRLVNRQFRRVVREYQQLLRDKYAVGLLWWAAWRGALLLLGYAACTVAMAQLFVWLVDPVYTFPEWVPAVLVEPKDIQTAFWNVWQKPASVQEWRTPELLRLRFYRELMGWCAGAVALLAGSLWGRGTQAVVPETDEPIQTDDHTEAEE